MKNKGFSLIELIMVIAIMTILVGAIAPAYLKYVEKTRIVADQEVIYTFAKTIEACVAETGLTSYEIFDQFYCDTFHDIDIYTKGVRLLEINKDGTAMITDANFINGGEGNFFYDLLTSCNIPESNLTKVRIKFKLFKSKALSAAIKQGNNKSYKHLMFTIDQNDVVRVWIGSQSENNGKHSTFSLPDLRFSYGNFTYS